LEVAENAHDFTSIDARIGASSGTLEHGRSGGQWSSPEHLMVETLNSVSRFPASFIWMA